MSRASPRVPARGDPVTPQPDLSGDRRPKLVLIPGGVPVSSADSSGDGFANASLQSVASAPHTFREGDFLSQRFRIIRFINSGGMGEVYEALDLELQERIAIKVIRPEIAADDAAIDRFKREIYLSRRVTHPNVCRVFDIAHCESTVADGRQSSVTFLTMELLLGETLSERIRRAGPLSTTEGLPIISQMAAGLAAAHRVGVVHRDFKSSNVMLLGSEVHDLRAVVTDFGLGRMNLGEAAEAIVTSTSEFIGTPAYMAPEQIEGEPVTAAADIYSLGVVIYEMITGHLPFAAEHGISSLLKRLKQPPPSPRDFIPDLERRWERVILRCLERNPSHRYARVEEVAKALEGSSLHRRIGAYEMLSREERPCKGQVYSAWDPQWDRVVELQILPSKISRDKDLRDEIRRQLEIVRGFSHPHICALYELGLQDSATFLVLEHLEGELLSHRLKDGPLPLQEALRYATQIAFALSDIHARGLVHGDLQTSAVMITEHAGAKLLELGLAPLSPRRAGEGQTQNESTICFDSLDATERGEAEDVLALGSILYEMVTGRKPFDASETDGNTSLDPPLLAPAQCFIPTALKELIRNCFGKNPDCTLTTAETVRARLEAISRSDEIKARTAPTMWSKASKPLTAILLTALVLVLASGRPWLASDVESVTSVILPPENAAFASAGREGGGPAISPDGQHVVFPAFSSGQRSLWMREVASLEARLIPSTEGASSPFWSPDSRTVGFFSDGKLKKVDAGGGPVIVISDADTPPAGGAFNQEGTALFGSIAGPIFAVHRPGEIPKPVTKLSRDEGSHRWPFFLPDGDHFLFFAAEAGSGRESQTGRVYVGSVAKNESRLLPIDPDSNVVYASGYLLYLQDGSLMAQAFDHARFALNGAPIKVTDQVFYETRIWRGNFSASDNGRLVYQPGREDSGAQLLWFNRSGVRIKTLGDEKLNISGISISKSGRKIVSDIFEPQSRLRDLWVHDSRTGIRSRLTFDPVRHEFPVWSPDESKVVFSRVSKDGRRDIYMKSLDGNGEETPLLQTEEQETPTDWSPDGRFIAYHSWIRGTRKLQIHVLPLEGVRKPFGFLVSEDSNGFATFSPDGHWLAFTSTKGNREEVYVASFPSGSGLTQISLEGGQSPRWNANGREIFYATPDSRLISARVRRSGTQLEVTSRKPLFTMATRKFVYDVAPTGNEFLVNTIQPSVSTPFILVTNWSRKVKDQP